jgi:CSLREA domain-containing protein
MGTLDFHLFYRHLFKALILVLSFLNYGCGTYLDGIPTNGLSTPSPSGLSYSGVESIYLQDLSMTTLSPSVSGSDISFSIIPALPNGMSFNTSTGEISGTPTAAASETTYTVTAANDHGEVTTSLTFEVSRGFLVNSTADDSDSSAGDGSCETASNECTLRAAVEETNAGLGYTPVILIPESYTIGTGGTEISITSDLEIVGKDTDTVVLDGGSSSRIFNISGGPTVEIRNLTIQNGREVDTNGGAVIATNSTLIVEDVTFDSNELEDTSVFTFGAAIYANGTTDLTVRRSLFQNNSFIGDKGGAGIAQRDDATTIVEDCTFLDNTAEGGGAIYTESTGDLIIKRSLFENNDTVSWGGAIDINCAQDDATTIEIQNSTFSGNDSGRGGGVFVCGDQTLTVKNSTFYNHTGHAIENGVAGSTTTLFNTLFYDGLSNSFCNSGGTFTSNGGNLAFPTDSDCNLTDPSDLASEDPELGSLTDNGGPTKTHALSSTSPAVDAGLSTGCPTEDQRGIARDSGCDVGAFEIE